MKKIKFAISLFCCVIIFCMGMLSGCKDSDSDKNNTDTNVENTTNIYNKKTVLSHETIGCGGYGAAFNAKIDPFNEKFFGATCDMGGVYFSFDSGENWERHNINGTVYCMEYDTSTDGGVWIGGSGVYKSTDHGKTLTMVFPKECEITASGNNYENVNHWLYTNKVSDYVPQFQIWSMAINRKSHGKNVFAAQRISASGMGVDKCIRIYRTTDGENFEFFTDVEYSYNFKLDFDEVNNCLIVALPNKILEISENGEVYTIDKSVYVQFSSGNKLCFDSCYDEKNNKNTFVFSTPAETDHLKTICYKTNNLRDETTYVDLTSELCSLTVNDFGLKKIEKYNDGLASYEYCEWINGKPVPQKFKWTISEVSVLNDNVVYLFHEAETDTFDDDGTFYIKRRTHIYLKYDTRAENHFKWIFGNPHKPYKEYISNVSWQDSDCAYCLGMTSSPKNENALLYCTNIGVYFTADGNTVKQLNCNVINTEKIILFDDNGNREEKSLRRVSSTGLEVICTQVVATDPFNPDHILMGCTDIGILQSYDNCDSWYRGLYEWSDGKVKDIKYAQYTNTCFDIHFDKEKCGVVYGIWSLAKSAPYAPGTSYLTKESRFGISYDGGLSWIMKNITKDGKGLPYKMQVVYDGDVRKIYIATDGNGFFVTENNGESFYELNDGIEVVQSGGNSAIWGNKILICGTETYAITGGNASNPDDGHMLYKLNNGTFEKIGLPSCEYNGKTYYAAAIRDIVYDEKQDCLYLACIANVVNNYSDFIKTAGGIWKYKDGVFTQIYDERKSVFGLNIDSEGRLFATELNGKLIMFDNDNTTYEVILDGLFHVVKGINFGATDDILYIPTWGGGTEKIILAECT